MVTDEAELFGILDQVNGVFFTGGSVQLIDEESGEWS
jgi:hypothetical protein